MNNIRSNKERAEVEEEQEKKKAAKIESTLGVSKFSKFSIHPLRGVREEESSMEEMRIFSTNLIEKLWVLVMLLSIQLVAFLPLKLLQTLHTHNSCWLSLDTTAFIFSLS